MEPTSSLVIKVKYGETLRRLTALVDENRKLVVNINGLREKIISLFTLPPDADLTLRYVDEDGDLVTLVDDEDLKDVMRQRLKFLRIDVTVSGLKSNQIFPSSKSLGVGDANALLNAEVLKSMPEPLREAVCKLSTDLASKAASSSPVISELVDCFSKLGLSLLKSDPKPTQGSELGSTSGAPNCPAIPDVTDSKTKNVNPTSETCASMDIGHKRGGFWRSFGPLHNHCVDLNIPPCDVAPSGVNNVSSTPSLFEDSTRDGWKEKSKIDDDKCGNSPSTSSAVPDKNSAPCGFAPPVQCPFAGVSVQDSAQPLDYERRHIPPLKRRFVGAPAMGGMFHRGIRCDGCGVCPITGPRFKSKVKEDYDLCSICYSEMGNDTDYIRMDRPVSYQHQRSLRSSLEQHPCEFPPTLPYLLRNFSLKPVRPKLDSRFVVDVNVVDGTMMGPSTPFTKIWRMRNNGDLVWPQGTQLIWIGGDNFSDNCSVDIEIPLDGLPLDKELDIAVDFKAPESPGRYISYWRMASPSGQKFGQRVWVLIQVDASLRDPTYDHAKGLNLNFPPEICGAQDPSVSDIKYQPISGGSMFLPSLSFGSPVEPGKQVSGEHHREEQEKNFPIDETLLVGHGASAPATSELPSALHFNNASGAGPAEAQSANVDALVGHGASVTATSELPSASYFKNVSGSGPAEAQSSNVDAPASTQGIANTIEECLLKELEEMGFKQIDLNKEILRLNEYNLEQSVDDLCGVAEWDPVLNELEEMGFHDKEMNKELLKKNNGSIKRVVMDLINGDTA